MTVTSTLSESSREDMDAFASINCLAVRWDHQKAICAGHGDEVTGALPAERCDAWMVAEFEGGGQKVGEAGLFLHSLGEHRLQEWNGRWRGPGKDFHGRPNEKVAGDHGGYGVAGETEDGLALADGEDHRFAGADSDRIENGFRAEFPKDGFDQIVFSGGDAAGKNEGVSGEASGDFCAKIVVSVLGIAEEDRFSVKPRDFCSERNGVAISDLEWAGSGSELHDFVAGGKNRDARLAVSSYLSGADLRGCGNLSETKTSPFNENGLAGRLFTAARNYMLPRRNCAVQRDGIAAALCVLDHDYSVGAFRERRAGHDLDAGAGLDSHARCVACFELADAAESCAGLGIHGAYGVAIADGAIKGRVVAVGENFLGQDAA